MVFALVLVLALLAGGMLGLLSVGAGYGEPVRGHALADATVAAPFRVGSCFTVAHPGSLRPASCSGDQAVFVINSVGREPADCSAVADFDRWGAVQRDRSANAAYCVSLLVGQGGCVVLGEGNAPHRVECGTDPSASRVVRLASATNPAAACTDLKNADVWYYRSPSSGQLACLRPDGS